MENKNTPKKKIKRAKKLTLAKIKKFLYTACVIVLALICVRNYLIEQFDSGVFFDDGEDQEYAAAQVVQDEGPELEYALAGSSASRETDANGNIIDHSNLLVSVKDPKTVMPRGFSLNDVPEYSGAKYCVVNGNVPFFTKNELKLASQGAFEYYGPLDSYGRCTVAFDCLGRETMPGSQKRGSISNIHPSGWKQARYDCVDSETVMTRAHLAGYMLSSENANERNLVTGTRYMNSDAMLIFEEDTQDYLYNSRGRHVLYRVTPIFKGSELMPRGVLMEAQSVEDGGIGVKYCVYIYNVQPGLKFNYSTGRSEYTGIFFDTDSSTVVTDGVAIGSYGLDTSTNTIHSAFCSEYGKVPGESRIAFAGDIDCESQWPAMGYKLCHSCLK